MISSLLNLANTFLELLNTPFGQFATRVVLVTTALTGLQGVLKGYMAFMKGGAIVSIITKIFSVAGPGVGIVERLAVALGGLNPVVAGVTAGIVALGLAIYGVKKYVDEVNKPLSDFNEEIDSINSQLQNNQTRLDEINAMPWNARTSEILEEKAALEKQNEELEKNLELLNQEKYERAQSEAENFVFNTGEQKTITRGGTTSRRMSTTFDVTVGGEKAYEEAARQLEEYRHQLEQTGQITDEQRQRFDEVNAAVAEQIEWLQVLVDRGDTLTESQQRMYDAYYALGNAYDVAVNGATALINAYTELTNTGHITESTYQQLIALYPKLADGAVQTANGYQIQESALLNLMSAEQRQQAEITNLVNGFIAEAQASGETEQALMNLVYAQITASNTGLNFTQQIAALQALAQQAGYTTSYVQAVLGASTGISQSNIERTAKGLMQTGKYSNYQDALAEATRRAQGALQYQWNRLTSSAPSGGYTTTFTGGSGVSAPSTRAPSTTSSGRTPSSSSSTSSRDDSRRAEAQAEIKRLQAQQDAVQDQIDEINAKYDAQLDELNDINDALEEQIQLQKLLQALTEAKASKKMVFKDGRFQYLSDVDAIAKAQSNLEDFYKEQELKKQKKRIEEERQAELAGLEAEKKYLQERISEWRDFISDMSYNYSSSLSGLSSYVDSWNSTIDSMKSPDVTLPDTGGGTPGGGTTGGGGTDPTPTPGGNGGTGSDFKTYDPPEGTSSAQIKKAQVYLGVTADGVWGSQSRGALQNLGISYAKLWDKVVAAQAYGAQQYSKGTSEAIRAVNGYVQQGYSKDHAYIKYGKSKGYAVGTLSAQSGLSMVGEQGPELRVLNKGDGIIPAKQTATLWSFANDPAKFLQNLNNIGGKTEIINVGNVSLPNVQNPQEFISGLRNLAYQRTYKPNFGTV